MLPEIRSLTFLFDPLEDHAWMSHAAHVGRSTCREQNVDLQTVRAATIPFPRWMSQIEPEHVVSSCRQHDIDYVSIGPLTLNQNQSFLESIPKLIESQEILFASAEIADRSGRIDLDRIEMVADLILELSTLTSQGRAMSNLYFCAMANCPPGSPFFPASYHDGGEAKLTIAVEGAPVALQVLQTASTLDQAQIELVSRIESAAQRLSNVGSRVSDELGIEFGGLDFSFAPYPDQARSIGRAIDIITGNVSGSNGSVFAAAFLTSCLDQADFERCGFSGLFLPVLEDIALASSVEQGKLRVNDLLLLSSVCGAGLDTLPLPGDISTNQLSMILRDIAALAVRADKPLTARLMPVPGAQAGDSFISDFSYFTPGQVMEVSTASTPIISAQGPITFVNRIKDR